MKQFITELNNMCNNLAQLIDEYHALSVPNFSEAKFLTQLSNVDQKTANRMATEIQSR